MAGANPMFNRIQQEIQQEQRYAGQNPAGYTQAASAGYAQQQSMSQEQLQQMYTQPSAGGIDTGRVTVDDVIMKSLALFVVLVVAGAAAWQYGNINPEMVQPLWFIGMFGGLALGLAIAFMKKIIVPLLFAYAALEGIFLGAFSQTINSIPQYAGVVQTAVLATVCTFAAMYLGYSTGIIKVSSRAKRIFAIVIMGYMIFSLVQLVLIMTGVLGGWGVGGSTMFGIIISVLGVGLAAYSLVLSFDQIQQAVAMGAPRKYSWLLAHGIIVSLVWLYIEFVRLFARLQDN